MAYAKRTTTANIPPKEVSLARGKENARPCAAINATATATATASATATARKALLFASDESASRPILSSSSNDGRTKEAGIARSLSGKKPPFRVHFDDPTLGSTAPATSEARDSNLDRGWPAVSVRSARKPLSEREDREQLKIEGSRRGARKRSIDECSRVEEKEKAENANRPLPSKIPRRSRLSSVPPSQSKYRSVSQRRSTSVEAAIGSRVSQRRSTSVEAAIGSRVSSTKRSGIAEKRVVALAARAGQANGRVADRVAKNAEKRGRFGGRGGSTRAPVDGQAPPPVSPTLLKAAIQRSKLKIEKPKEVKRTEAESSGKQRDPFPIELLYHFEYHDDLPMVELERDEKSPRLSSNFLTNRVNAEQRRLVVVFMIRIGSHCRYPSYIVYQSVKLFDAVVDRIPVDTAFIQLAALASLWIQLKKQENFHKIPTATTMLALARELYEEREDLLIAYERMILRVLNFNVTFADAFTMFAHHLISCRRCVELSDETATFLYNCGCYAIDTTLLDEQFCRTPISLVSVTVTELVLGLTLDAVVANAKPRWLFWRGLLFATIPCFIDRFEDGQIDRTRVAILRHLSISARKRDGFEVVYRKYCRSRYGCVSESFLERVARLSPTEIFDS